MAAAPSPLHVDQESDMHAAAHNVAPVSPSTHVERRPLNPALIVMLIALAAYPFVVGYLPESVRQYLGALFR